MSEAMTGAFDLPRAEAPLRAPPATARPEALREVAQELEAVLLTGEKGKLISRSGGAGVGDAILREMLKAQEIA